MTDTPPEEPIEYDLPDLTDYSDEKLDALADLVTEVREKRRRQRNIPGIVASLAQEYGAGGGDKNVLVDAVTAPPEPQSAPDAGTEPPES